MKIKRLTKKVKICNPSYIYLWRDLAVFIRNPVQQIPSPPFILREKTRKVGEVRMLCLSQKFIKIKTASLFIKKSKIPEES
jgi:hypothetical protein